jgi:hypothetical protein
MAKFDPPNSRTMAKLIPITLPSLLKSGPPDPPFGDGNPVGQKIEVKAVKNPIRPPLDASFEIIGVGGDVKNFGPPTARQSHGFHSQYDSGIFHAPFEDDGGTGLTGARR